ncbi:clustered mitochondria-domain-containing protein [Syncephalis fuscata]|nr:clustered mitochondria-domain-containing protein [Syncephalis fuscata]
MLNVNLPYSTKPFSVQVSTQECVQDVRQAIIESPETCIYSCFYLAFNGQRLNDYTELGAIEAFTPEDSLTLVEDNYTEREARIHVARLRDMLQGLARSNALAVGVDPSLACFTAVTGDPIVEDKPVEKKKSNKKTPSPAAAVSIKPHAFADYNVEALPSVDRIIPAKVHERPIPCLNTLTLSGWNPIPHVRRLQGDLLYVSAVTLEGEAFCITASIDGFYVNNCTDKTFDPTANSKYKLQHSLVKLLQSISSKFATGFEKLQAQVERTHMLETVPVTTALPAYPWCVKSGEPVFDAGRPADTYLNFGADAVDSLRDWNDELQSSRELPRTNMQERVQRDRALNKVLADFSEAAVRGAVSVVNGNVPAINPMDPPEVQMYIYNNIFFSKGFDGRGTFEQLGGEMAAHAATGKDLEGVRILNQLDVEGLHTLGCVVVDYKGQRVVAQSIVPGIFRRQDESSIVYGSIDGGQTVSADEEFHKLAGQLAKSLHYSEHTVKDGDDKEHTLYTSLETKGLMGADGRRYLLDLYRLLPTDVLFQEEECDEEKAKEKELPVYPHKLTLLRSELVDLVWEHRLRVWVNERVAKIRAEKEAKDPKAASTTDKDTEEGDDEAQELQADPKPEAEKPTDDSATASNNNEEDGAKTEEDPNLKIDVNDFEFNLNPDAFTPVQHLIQSSPEADQKTENVREASKFLRSHIIPLLVNDLTSYQVTPIDGNALTVAMHRRGINMRYLGRVVTALEEVNDKRLGHVKAIVVQEMVVRAAKHILRRLLQTVTLRWEADCIAHFLNCLLGRELNRAPKAKFNGSNPPAYVSLTPALLDEQIGQEVALRYRYKLADVTNTIEQGIRKLPVLREICLRVGVQIEARNYAFDHYQQSSTANKSRTASSLVFTPADIINILPVVKEAPLKSFFVDEAFEAGKVSLSQGNKELGIELLMESLSLHEQIYGFLHPETARCYAALALVYRQLGDNDAAEDFQRRAVIVAERVVGIDHADTINYYMNLGLFEHALGKTQLALRYLRRAMDCWRVVYGDHHPDSATADNNVAVMLQSLNDFAGSLNLFQRARDTYQLVLGPKHIVTTNCIHTLAKAYALSGDFKLALKTEKTAYNAYRTKLGEEDPRTKESAMWLEEFTARAVDSARKEKQSNGRSLTELLNGDLSEPTTAGQLSSGKPVHGDLPIEDLLAYINEPNGQRKKKSGKGKKRDSSTKQQ